MVSSNLKAAIDEAIAEGMTPAQILRPLVMRSLNPAADSVYQDVKRYLSSPSA